MEIAHPSEWLDRAVIETIRERGVSAEKHRDLDSIQLAIIIRRKWFKLFVPRKFGGLEYTLPEAVRLEEALAYADGATAWVVTLCAGAGWFAGFVQEGIVKEFFVADNACIAGSGAATGTAEKVTNGYRINGSWKYASGSLHATAFTANCQLIQNGSPVVSANGSPVIVTFIFHRHEVQVNRTWNMMGMIATGSHRFEIKDIEVPESRRFIINADNAVLDQHIYQYPFDQFAETTLAVNLSGMACRFMELADDIFKKRHEDVKDEKGESVLLLSDNSLKKARREFYRTIDASWQQSLDQSLNMTAMLKRVSEVSHESVRVSRNTVNSLYPLCGLNAADVDTEINRVWRNFHTAAQHAVFSKR